MYVYIYIYAYIYTLYIYIYIYIHRRISSRRARSRPHAALGAKKQALPTAHLGTQNL